MKKTILLIAILFICISITKAQDTTSTLKETTHWLSKKLSNYIKRASVYVNKNDTRYYEIWLPAIYFDDCNMHYAMRVAKHLNESNYDVYDLAYKVDLSKLSLSEISYEEEVMLDSSKISYIVLKTKDQKKDILFSCYSHFVTKDTISHNEENKLSEIRIPFHKSKRLTFKMVSKAFKQAIRLCNKENN